MKRYGKYIRPYWYAFILGPLLMLTEVAGEVLLPSFMADIINIGAAKHGLHRLRRLTSAQGFERMRSKKSRPSRFRKSTGSPRALWLRV